MIARRASPKPTEKEEREKRKKEKRKGGEKEEEERNLTGHMLAISVLCSSII